MDIDENMILVYFNQYPLSIPPTNHSINSTVNITLNDDLEELADVHFYRAILAFLLTILLYFCLVCRVWKEEAAEGKPEVIEKSIVRKVSIFPCIDASILMITALLNIL